MKRSIYFFLALVLLILSACQFAPAQTSLSRTCGGQNPTVKKAIVEVASDGSIKITPCAAKSVTVNGSPITGSSPAVATVSNSGATGDGEAIAKSKIGDDISLKRLQAGAGIAITSNTNAIIISAGGGGSNYETILSSEGELNTAKALALANPQNTYSIVLNNNVTVAAPTTTGTAQVYANNIYLEAATPTPSASNVGKAVIVYGQGVNGSDLITRITGIAGGGGDSYTLAERTRATVSGQSFAFIQSLPKNAVLKSTNGGELTAATSASALLVEGEIDAPKTSLFNGFAAGKVKITSQTTKEFYPEWFGASRNGTADDYPAIQQLIDAINISPNNGISTSGGKIIFSGGNYRSSGNFIVRRSYTFAGNGSCTTSAAATITFDANVKGFLFHSATSETGADQPGSSDGSTVQCLHLVGQVGANTHTVNIAQGTITAVDPNTSTFTATKTAGENFDASTNYGSGQTFNIAGLNYIIADNSATTTTLNLKPFRFIGTMSASALSDVSMYSNSSFVGAKITIDNETRTIVSQSGGGVTVNAPFAVHNGFVDVYYTPANATGLGARINKFHGIDFRSRIKVIDNYITGFAGNGINVDSHQPNSPNSNYIRVEGNRIDTNEGHGIFTSGINSNAGKFLVNDSSNNKAYGYYDNSFLGNTYDTNHGIANAQGGYYSADNVNATSFVFNYHEGYTPSNHIGINSLWFAGNPDNGFSKTGQGAQLTSNGGGLTVTSIGSLLTPARFNHPYGASFPNGSVGLGAANGSQYPQLLTFKNNADNDGYQLDYGIGYPRSGYFSLKYGLADNRVNNSNSAIISFSGSSAAEGAGVLWFNKGFRVGYSNADGSPDVTVSNDTAGRLTVNRVIKSPGVFSTSAVDGVIFTKADGTCARVTVSNANAFVITSIVCP